MKNMKTLHPVGYYLTEAAARLSKLWCIVDEDEGDDGSDGAAWGANDFLTYRTRRSAEMAMVSRYKCQDGCNTDVDGRCDQCDYRYKSVVKGFQYDFAYPYGVGDCFRLPGWASSKSTGSDNFSYSRDPRAAYRERFVVRCRACGATAVGHGSLQKAFYRLLNLEPSPGACEYCGNIPDPDED